MDKKIIEQLNYWNSLSHLDPNASVIDPNDSLGYKNLYIANLRNYYFNHFTSNIKNESVILDFGCGTGSSTFYLKQNNAAVIGMDISNELLQIANSRCPEKNCFFVLIDGMSLPLKGKTISHGFVYVVLSYIVDDQSLLILLRELKRVLQPGAVLVVIEQARMKTTLSADGLKKQRSIEDWIALFLIAGFSVATQKVIRYGHFPTTYLVRYGCAPKFIWPFLKSLEYFCGKCFSIFPWSYAEVLFEVRA